jgi:hypothetical protein
VDRQDFLKTLAEACRKTDWQCRNIVQVGCGSIDCWGSLWRSTKLTHLCSDKLTHPVSCGVVFSFQGVAGG